MVGRRCPPPPACLPSQPRSPSWRCPARATRAHPETPSLKTGMAVVGEETRRGQQELRGISQARTSTQRRANSVRGRSRRVSSGRSRRTSARCSPTCPPPRRRLQEKQQGLQRDLDRVQTPHRRGLRPNPSLLRADLGLRPRQPGRHSLDDHDERPRLLSLRSHGRRLRRRRDPRPEPDAGGHLPTQFCPIWMDHAANPVDRAVIRLAGPLVCLMLHSIR